MASDNLKLLLAALTGAVAAQTLRIIVKISGKLTMSRPIATYYYSDSVPIKVPGMVSHAYGSRVQDSDSQKQAAWEYSKPLEEHNERHILYGPYSNDFSRPGYYKIRFRIKGKGIPSKIDYVLRLDIVQNHHHPDVKMDYTAQTQTIAGAMLIHSNNFREDFRYKEYDIIIYSQGSGEFEYRCFVNHAVLAPDSKLLFDLVSVYRHLPWLDVFS